jgi:CubicO group peptidase (beta-lactamase class C family)
MKNQTYPHYIKKQILILQKISNMRHLILFILVTFTFSVFAQKPDLQKLEVYIQKCMTEWEIPGMAVGIVKNDTLIFAKGFGIREIGKPEKVDENTMFGIASNTKAFTAAALATLVDEGKIKWDDKVTDYIPYFEMYDPFVTHEMTIRDLLCHRSGLETFSGDLIWDATTYTREEIIKRIKYLKPVYSFRSHYGYSNVLVLTAGEIIPKVTGKSYDEYIREKFFEPLGMKNTNTTIKKHAEYKNLAIPHARNNGKTVTVKYISWDNIAPAGGINSTVNDMSKWIKMQLNNGTQENHLFFTKDAQREMWSAQTVEDISKFDDYMFPSMHFHSYGLGWDLFDYHGKKVINHSGGLDGMISQVVLVPEEKLGFVILTNNINYLPYTLMYSIMDRFFNVEGKDYSSILVKYVKANEENKIKEEKEAEEKRNKNSKTTLPLEKYCGTYGGDLYGNATITLKEGKLNLQFVPAPDFFSVLEHWQYDAFVVEFKNFPSLPKGKVNFILNQNAEVYEFKIDVPNPDFDFTELTFKRIMDKSQH